MIYFVHIFSINTCDYFGQVSQQAKVIGRLCSPTDNIDLTAIGLTLDGGVAQWVARLTRDW